ncbi:MAG: hypothetical protein KJ638_12020 [Chloroflexi bacterium]|nr:hypothetical protein [Chloroflexota bacterium]
MSKKYPMKNATHDYKGQPVRLRELTYISYGQQYCTIDMVNKDGKIQRQTVQLRRLTPLTNRYSAESISKKDKHNV